MKRIALRLLAWLLPVLWLAQPAAAGTVGSIGTVTIPAAIFTGADSATKNAATIGPQTFTISFTNSFTSTSRFSLTINLGNATFANQSFTMTTTGTATSSLSSRCGSMTILNSSISLDNCQAASGQTITGVAFAAVSYKDAAGLASIGTSITIGGTINNATNTSQVFETIPATAVVTSKASDDPNVGSSATLSVPGTASTTEGAGSVSITVTRGGALTTAVTVNYATANGTATAGADFTQTTGTLSFAANETTKTISIPILADSAAESAETFTLVLSAASAGANITASTTTITIGADLVSGKATILNASSVTIPAAIFTGDTTTKNAANIGPQSFTVQFLNTFQGGTKFTLELIVSNATLTGSVSGAATGSITTSAATLCSSVTVLQSKIILDTCTVPSGQTVTGMTLSGVTYRDAAALSTVGNSIFMEGTIYNAANGSQVFETVAKTAIVTSKSSDDPNAPTSATLSIATSATTSASASPVSLTVSRAGVLSSAVTVNYATADGNAKAGTDYTSTSGTLSFAANEVSKTISVPILLNAALSNAATFTVTLSNASTGASISSATATVTIAPSRTSLTLDNYYVIAPTFTGTDLSFIRFANSNAAAHSITVKVVGSPSGTVYGTADYSIPSNASPQYALSDIITKANAGALKSGDTSYALYLSQEAGMSFQHVVWSSTTGFFENMTSCTAPNISVNASSQNRQALNVHTSILTDYPAYISVHNAYTSAQTYVATLYDATTGARLGAASLQVAANATVTQPMTYFQSAAGFTPSASQFHVNMYFSTSDVATLGSFYGVVTHYILNKGRYSNMSTWCATTPR